MYLGIIKKSCRIETKNCKKNWHQYWQPSKVMRQFIYKMGLDSSDFKPTEVMQWEYRAYDFRENAPRQLRRQQERWSAASGDSVGM
uniref:Uncharacterized protein n=1 Tax=Spironucleus salmonicida TaxID=348837 RepID=V6LPH7_9EUKA|eukprot:EST45621.1 Hypothetical protein SS50377_14478 [Spironucleus salmonicida]